MVVEVPTSESIRRREAGPPPHRIVMIARAARSRLQGSSAHPLTLWTRITLNTYSRTFRIQSRRRHSASTTQQDWSLRSNSRYRSNSSSTVPEISMLSIVFGTKATCRCVIPCCAKPRMLAAISGGESESGVAVSCAILIGILPVPVGSTSVAVSGKMRRDVGWSRPRESEMRRETSRDWRSNRSQNNRPHSRACLPS
jgi:hypothetical protein